jgi:hypothetical protein
MACRGLPVGLDLVYSNYLFFKEKNGRKKKREEEGKMGEKHGNL